MNPMRIAIVGGGPGGLMTAYLLDKRLPFPFTTTLYEASARLGGKVVTRRFQGTPVIYEAGAAELYDYSQLGQDPLREMVAELGLTTRPMWGQSIFLGDHLLKEPADLRRQFGPASYQALKRFNRQARALISPAEYYESDWKADNEDPLSRHSFRALLRRVPDEAARRYIEVAVHSDLATEPHRTSAMYGLQNYLVNDADYMKLYSIDGGNERLTQELARRISAKVLLQHPVTRVERTAQGKYTVVARGPEETLVAEHDCVVVALPSNWIPAVEWGGPVLAEAMHRHHAFYDYPAHYLRVSVLFERPFWRDLVAESYFMLDAFGGCCVYDESSRNGGGACGVLGWLLAGDAALTLSNLDDNALMAMMLDSLPRSLRHGKELFREGHVHRWVGTVNGRPGGFPAIDPDARHLPEPTEHPRLFVVGDYLFDSTLNGVLDSADVVAEYILEEGTPEPAVVVEGPAFANPAVARNGAVPVPSSPAL